LKSLKYLDLSYNHLSRVGRNSFGRLPGLIGIRLDHNSIVEVGAGSFDGLSGLETLIINNNGLRNLRSGSVVRLPRLEKMVVSSNLVEGLEVGALEDLPALRELHLDRNLIKGLGSSAFIDTPSIRYLNLSHNLLQDLPRSGFVGMETLESLDLSFNDLRIIDKRAFESMIWLSELKLNDNNICRIEDNAFKDFNSLRSLSLENNRLMKIPRSSFSDIKFKALSVAGNPFKCDCETLWLRNLVTDGVGVVSDLPTCHFPSALSGNELRKLRTSRFTCDRPAMRSRKDNIACSATPTKRPNQQQIIDQLNRGYLKQSSSSNLVEVEVSTVRPDDVISPEEDVDAVDVDPVTTKNPNADEKSDEYEYYYVYYDQDGNVVNKKDFDPGQVTLQTPETAQVLRDKVAEIQLPADDQTGDTPTMYAGIKNMTQHEEDTEGESEEGADDKEEGLSIFGIPIPKIPLPILSFGLAPALSHGLLPIGRKGDAAEVTAGPADRRTRLPPLDGTRGPDEVSPIWVDQQQVASGLKQKKRHTKNNYPGGVDSGRQPPLSNSFYPSEQTKTTRPYGYLEPQNPIIPLSRPSQHTPRGPPAIKFDHPVPQRGPDSLGPIVPNPSLSHNFKGRPTTLFIHP